MNDNHLQEAEQICFSGAGSMAESIVRGLIHKGVAAPAQIIMHNRSNQERLRYLSEQYGVRTASQDEQKDNDLREASVIVLAMKPKDAAEALRQLGPKLSGNPLIVSVIAGLSISTIQALLGKSLPIARTMPNTSSSIGLGATGLSLSDEVSAQQRQTVLSMLQAVGLVSVIPEAQMDILTGVSGSGPAYIYYMMEAMITAGVEGGLNAEQARELTVQTVLGAAIMMKETSEDPAKLRKDITSPNGSTQAALEVLDAHQFTEGVKAAVHRCAERSREMGDAVKAALT